MDCLPLPRSADMAMGMRKDLTEAVGTLQERDEWQQLTRCIHPITIMDYVYMSDFL
jgi:hypothetical protein